jgi:hypothetical protein
MTSLSRRVIKPLGDLCIVDFLGGWVKFAFSSIQEMPRAAISDAVDGS